MECPWHHQTTHWPDHPIACSLHSSASRKHLIVGKHVTCHTRVAIVCHCWDECSLSGVISYGKYGMIVKLHSELADQTQFKFAREEVDFAFSCHKKNKKNISWPKLLENVFCSQIFLDQIFLWIKFFFDPHFLDQNFVIFCFILQPKFNKKKQSNVYDFFTQLKLT